MNPAAWRAIYQW